jgi:hypothetical protein
MNQWNPSPPFLKLAPNRKNDGRLFVAGCPLEKNFTENERSEILINEVTGVHWL